MKYYDEQLWYEFMWWWMMMKWCGMMIDRRYPFCQSAGGSLPSASSLSEGPSPKKCIVMVTKLGGLSGLRVCPQRLFPRNHQVWIFRNRWLRAMLSESWWDLGKLSCCVGSVSVDPWTKTEAWQTAAKAIRMLHMFRTVWRLVYGLLTSGNTMLSTFFILLLTLYIFACLGAVHPTGLEMARKLARLGNLQPSSRRLQ